MLTALASCGSDDGGGAEETTAGTTGGGTSGTTTTGAVTETEASSSDTDGDTDTETGEPEPEPLMGIADLHLHMFAEEAFGGGWLHGSHRGSPEQALGDCDGGIPGDHGRLKEELAPLIGSCGDLTPEELGQMVPLVDAIVRGGGDGVGEYLGIIPGSDGDTGLHEDRTEGHPGFGGWPAWDTIAHQQAWEEQLFEAYQDGLRVEVMSAVSLNWLCKALPDENVSRPECDEMADVIVQLEMANELAAAHDWMEVALSAADARRIVSEDKLALILSVEASHIMGGGDWRPQFDQLYDLGVRTLQPVHQMDNRFGGAAPHNTIFHIAVYAETCHIDTDCGLTTPSMTLGFDVDENCRNTLGLTDEGKELIALMIERGMLIDAAHLSERSVDDLFALSVENQYYPFYFSHGHFREIMTPEKAIEEKTTPASIIQMLRETGGMFGLRTAHEETNTYEPSPVSNTCHGSSRSFAQAYDYGRLGLKVKMGMGSDLNGFIQQTRPRFGSQACSASFAEEATCQARDERAGNASGLGNEFDDKGLGHIGMLGALLDDLDQLGSDSGPMRRSADDFVRMWERAEGTREGAVPLDEPMDLAGVVIEPSHDERKAAMPTICDDRYCPGGIASGEECRFDEECENGTCGGAGECGTPTGICN